MNNKSVFRGAALALAIVVWLKDSSDYGLRFGFWRLLQLLERHDLRATLVVSPLALARCPEIVRAARHHSWEMVLLIDEPQSLNRSFATGAGSPFC